MQVFGKIVSVALFLVLMSLTACSSRQPREPERVIETITIKDPGAEEYVWEPPMVDQVEVPPGLDSEGHYYRPAHEEVVEVRQGRWVRKEPKDYQKEE